MLSVLTYMIRLVHAVRPQAVGFVGWPAELPPAHVGARLLLSMNGAICTVVSACFIETNASKEAIASSRE